MDRLAGKRKEVGKRSNPKYLIDNILVRNRKKNQ
jgi:hypothetical protein